MPVAASNEQKKKKKKELWFLSDIMKNIAEIASFLL